MTDPVFEHDDCDVEPVDPIPDDNMLVDPTVPEPPDSIPDCFNTTPSPLPPPIPGLPDPGEFCPTIEVRTATVIYDNIPEPDLSFSFERSTGCAFFVDFDLRLPNAVLDCPSITIDGGGSGGSITVDENASDAAILFTVTKHPTLCTFDFNLDIVIPNFCPVITTTGSSIAVNPLASVPTLSFDVIRLSSGADCDINLDLDIELPDFCPTLSVGSATISINSVISTPTIDFSIDKNPSACDFVFDLDIELPDFCPQFNSGDSTVNLDENITSPTMSIDFVRDEGGEEGEYNCQFEVSASVSVPAKRVDVVEDIGCDDNRLVLRRKQILVFKEIQAYAPFYVPCCCIKGNTQTDTDFYNCLTADFSALEGGNLFFEIENLTNCECLNGFAQDLFYTSGSNWLYNGDGVDPTGCSEGSYLTITLSLDPIHLTASCGVNTGIGILIECEEDPFKLVFDVQMFSPVEELTPGGCCIGFFRITITQLD